MQSLYSTSKQYLHKADRTFPSLDLILKSFANGHFLKVMTDTVSFSPLDIFIFFWVFEEKKQLSTSQILYNKLEKYLSIQNFFNGK